MEKIKHAGSAGRQDAGKTGELSLVLGAAPGKSGGKNARTPNASRGSQKPGSREAFGLRVSLAPLWGRVAPSRQGWQGNEWQRNRFWFSFPLPFKVRAAETERGRSVACGVPDGVGARWPASLAPSLAALRLCVFALKVFCTVPAQVMTGSAADVERPSPLAFARRRGKEAVGNPRWRIFQRKGAKTRRRRENTKAFCTSSSWRLGVVVCRGLA